MITLTVGEFKAKFSEVVQNLLQGKEVAISYGRKKQKIGMVVPMNKYKKVNKIKLGLLEGKATAIFKKDFKITDEEFLSS